MIDPKDINPEDWLTGYRTGLDSPVMRAMTSYDLMALARAHRDLGTSHDLGMCAAAVMLAMRKRDEA